MKILAIRGENLASLQRFAVELCAPPLSEAGIFLISGPTGAGKSTLLDALCLALYDQTPRLSGARSVLIGYPGEVADLRISATDPRSILRRGAVEASAEVDFACAGRRYRATWRVRRARGRSDGRVQNQEIFLRDLTSGTDLTSHQKTETLKLIEGLIGLNFPQFCRSVLLAQGEFAQFLRARDSERAELLEKMTGTEIYGALSMRAYQRAQKEGERLADLQRDHAAAHLLPPDERDNLLGEQKVVIGRRQTLSRDIDALSRAVAWHVEHGRLTDDLAAAATALSAARSRTTDAEAQALAAALALHEKAQSLSPLIEAADQAAAQSAATAQALVHAAADSQKAQQKAAEKAESEAAAGRALAAARQALIGLEPALLAARSLDGKIEQAAERSHKAEQAAAAAEQAAAAAVARLQDLLQQQQADERASAQAAAWLDGHRRVEPLVPGWERVRKDLLALSQAQGAAAAAAAEQQRLERERDQAHRHLAKQVEALRAPTARKQALADELAAARTRLDEHGRAHPGETVRQKRERLHIALTGIESLTALCGECLRLCEREKQKIALCDTATQEATKKRALAQAAAERLERLLGEQKQKTGDLALARAAQDLAARRADLLHDGKPCPLCGSVEHPAALAPADPQAQKSQQARLVAGLSAECERLTVAISAQRAEQGQLAQEAHALHKVAEQAAADRRETAQDLSGKSADFAHRAADLAAALASQPASQPASQSAGMAAQRRGDPGAGMAAQRRGDPGADMAAQAATPSAAPSSRGKSRAAVQKDPPPGPSAPADGLLAALAVGEVLDALDPLDPRTPERLAGLRTRLAAQDGALRQIEEAAAALQTARDAAQHDYDECLSQLERLTLAIDQRRAAAAQADRLLAQAADLRRDKDADAAHLRGALADPLRSIAGWETQLADAATLVATLTTEVAHFVAATGKRDQADRQRAARAPHIAVATAERERLAAEQQGTARQLGEARAALADLRAGRAQLLSGRPAAEAERAAKSAVATTEAAAARALSEAAATREAAAARSAAEIAARRAADAAASLSQAAAQRLAAEVAATPIGSLAELRRLLAMPPAVRADLRQKLAERRDDLTRADAAHADRQRRLDEHQTRQPGQPAPSPSSQADLQARLAAAQGEHTLAVERAGAVQQRLDEDARGRAALADLLPQIERQKQVAKDWDQVNQLIGSADGKKFRKFAQSLTLDALIAQANSHLKSLQPRYTLERIPHYDMDLQVIDHDMGDEVRGCTTLSGGESFLVSLALALGLSSLSSRDVRIESLFIDEGFGTLDSDTLDVAIATLDQLQMQGRKVGLISHVQDLSDRIAHRVVVDKRGSGFSTVTTVGWTGPDPLADSTLELTPSPSSQTPRRKERPSKPKKPSEKSPPPPPPIIEIPEIAESVPAAPVAAKPVPAAPVAAESVPAAPVAARPVPAAPIEVVSMPAPESPFPQNGDQLPYQRSQVPFWATPQDPKRMRGSEDPRPEREPGEAIDQSIGQSPGQPLAGSRPSPAPAAPIMTSDPPPVSPRQALLEPRPIPGFSLQVQDGDTEKTRPVRRRAR